MELMQKPKKKIIHGPDWKSKTSTKQLFIFSIWTEKSNIQKNWT